MAYKSLLFTRPVDQKGSSLKSEAASAAFFFSQILHAEETGCSFRAEITASIMFSRRLLTITLLITVVSGYLYFFDDLSFCIYTFVAGVLLSMSSYIFHHQIDWWWYQRNPPSLPIEMQKMFLRFGNFYQTLDHENKKVFDTRARLFVEAKEFIAQGPQDVAEDIKYMIAYYAVMLTFRKAEYLFHPYHRIVIYLHPFLSPNFPDHVHTYELEHEDGTVILSLEQLTAGYFSPSKFYQTGLHAFAELFASNYRLPSEIPESGETWVRIEKTGQRSKQAIEDFTGMPQASVAPILLHQFFTAGDSMKLKDPALYEQVELWIN